MFKRMLSRSCGLTGPLRSTLTAGVVLFTMRAGSPAPHGPHGGLASGVCRGPVTLVARAPDPFAIPLTPTANGGGASGEARLSFAQSPFGLAVTADGRHRYRVRVATDGLRAAPDRSYVAWAVSPTLDELQKLGVLAADGAVNGEVTLNKFVVFVTSETSVEVERWSGPIVLRGISRSGRMHTMAGHGPFEGEPCL